MSTDSRTQQQTGAGFRLLIGDDPSLVDLQEREIDKLPEAITYKQTEPLDLFTGETVLDGVVNHVHRLLQVIHPLSHMASLAKAVLKAGYGTSAIEYVLPTMGR